MGINCPPGQLAFNNGCMNFVNFGDFCEFTRQCNFFGSQCQQNKCTCGFGQIYDGLKCISNTVQPLTSKNIIKEFCLKFF